MVRDARGTSSPAPGGRFRARGGGSEEVRGAPEPYKQAILKPPRREPHITAEAPNRTAGSPMLLQQLGDLSANQAPQNAARDSTYLIWELQDLSLSPVSGLGPEIDDVRP